MNIMSYLIIRSCSLLFELCVVNLIHEARGWLRLEWHFIEHLRGNLADLIQDNGISKCSSLYKYHPTTTTNGHHTLRSS